MVRQLSQVQASSAPPVYESQINISVTAEQTNIANLMVSAQSVLSEAKSVVARSEDGSDHSSSVTTILHRLDSLEQDMEDSITVTQGHHPPKPLQPNVERHGVVENWIPTVPLRSDRNDLDSSSVATRTQMTPTQSSYETTTIASAYPESVGGRIAPMMMTTTTLNTNFCEASSKEDPFTTRTKNGQMLNVS